MRTVIKIILLVLACIGESQCISSEPLRATLRNLRTVLRHTKDFVGSMQELKYVLQEIQMKKMIAQNTKSNLEPMPCGDLNAGLFDRTMAELPSKDLSKDCKNSTCKKFTTSSPKVTRAPSKVVPTYSSGKKMLMSSTYGNKKTKEDRRVKWDCKVAVPNPPSKYNPISKAPPAEGTVVKGCGKKDYFMSSRKIKVMLSLSYCCTVGMHMAVVNDSDSMDCLLDYYRSMKPTKGKSKPMMLQYFTTAYVDITLAREFDSIIDGHPMPEDMWTPGEPDNKGGDEAAVALKLTRDESIKSGYEDVASMQEVYGLCEYP